MAIEGTRRSYDAVADRYADEIGGELAGKPLDRALLACLAELCAETAADGLVADVGCGPGHITAFLADLGTRVVGVDLSPGMVTVARRRYPELTFTVGSLLGLPVADGGWAGAVCAYSLIHLDRDERCAAYAELARAITPGGWLLVSFHVDNPEYATGQVAPLTEWWGTPVELEFHFLDPAEVTTGLAAAGFTVMARTDRQPSAGVEHQSRRSYLLARRDPAP